MSVSSSELIKRETKFFWRIVLVTVKLLASGSRIDRELQGTPTSLKFLFQADIQVSFSRRMSFKASERFWSFGFTLENESWRIEAEKRRDELDARHVENRWQATTIKMYLREKKRIREERGKRFYIDVQEAFRMETRSELKWIITMKIILNIR